MLSRCHFCPRLLQFAIVASFDCKAAFCSGVNLMSPSNRSWFSKSSSAVGKDYHLTLLHAFTYKEVQMHLIYVFTSCLVMIIKLYSMKNPWKCSMVLCCYLNVVMSLLLPTCMAYVSAASCHNQLLFVCGCFVLVVSLKWWCSEKLMQGRMCERSLPSLVSELCICDLLHCMAPSMTTCNMAENTINWKSG